MKGGFSPQSPPPLDPPLGGLIQGTNLLGRGVQNMLELGGSGGMPPQENFET